MNDTKESNVIPSQGNTDMLEIHSSVIASIARKSVSGVDGVIRLADGSLVDNIAEMVGSGSSNLDRSIVVDSHDGAVSLWLRIIVDMNCHAAKVAYSVQKTVADDVAAMTGLQIREVNVMVMDFEEPDNTSPEM